MLGQSAEEQRKAIADLLDYVKPVEGETWCAAFFVFPYKHIFFLLLRA
jgi:hypothetical protein